MQLFSNYLSKTAYQIPDAAQHETSGCDHASISFICIVFPVDWTNFNGDIDDTALFGFYFLK